MIQKPERHRCQAHLKWVATIPCIACTNGNITPERYRTGEVVAQAHHLTIAQPKARGMRAGDQWVLPMCQRHHDPNNPGSLHHAGNERAWWQARMDEAWDEIATTFARTPPLHMLRGMQLSGMQWPFASVDSTDIARNHCRDHNAPRAMADRWDAMQTPHRWTVRARQMELA